MAMKRGASADSRPRPVQPGPYMQTRTARGRNVTFEEGSDGSQDRTSKDEPQEQVRARIQTIEGQIQ